MCLGLCQAHLAILALPLVLNFKWLLAQHPISTLSANGLLFLLMGKAGVQYLVFVCWVTLWTQTDISVMELNLSTSFIEHMNCSLMVESLCICRTGPTDLGRSWALEGALTTIDTSKVKNVFSKAPKIMKYMRIPPHSWESLLWLFLHVSSVELAGNNTLTLNRTLWANT